MFNSTKDEIRNKHVQILNKEIGSEKLSRNIEKQLYNSAVNTAKTKCVVRKWSNPVFHKLYVSKIRSFYSNISNKEPTFKIQVLKIEY